MHRMKKFRRTSYPLILVMSVYSILIWNRHGGRKVISPSSSSLSSGLEKTRNTKSALLRHHGSSQVKPEQNSSRIDDSMTSGNMELPVKRTDDDRVIEQPTEDSHTIKESNNLANELYALWETKSNSNLCTEGPRRGQMSLVGGDGFRCLADVYYDETFDRGGVERLNASFSQLKNSARRAPVIFVKSDFISEFFERWHSQLPTERYIIVTHNSDYGMPRNQNLPYLNDDKLLHWYAQNIVLEHPKLSPIPIGLGNRMWDVHAEHYLEARNRFLLESGSSSAKNRTLVLNFTPRNRERRELQQQFRNVSWATVQDHHGYETYQDPQHRKKLTTRELNQRWLADMARYRFVASPPGNGLDCHRTWELMIMGVCPIVRTTTLDALYQDIPAVLIVQRWKDITKELLDQHWQQHGNSLLTEAVPPFLTQRYWMKKIWTSALSTI